MVFSQKREHLPLFCLWLWLCGSCSKGLQDAWHLQIPLNLASFTLQAQLYMYLAHADVTPSEPSDWSILFVGFHFQFHGQYSHQSVSSQTVVKSTSTTLSPTLFQMGWSRGAFKLARYMVLTLGYPGSLYPGYPIITFYLDLTGNSGAWHQPDTTVSHDNIVWYIEQGPWMASEMDLCFW